MQLLLVKAFIALMLATGFLPAAGPSPVPSHVGARAADDPSAHP